MKQRVCDVVAEPDREKSQSSRGCLRSIRFELPGFDWFHFSSNSVHCSAGQAFAVDGGKPHGATTYSGAQLSLDTRDRLIFSNSTEHCVVSAPKTTATNMGGQPRRTINWFSSLLLTPSDFNSRSTVSSCAPFRVNSTTTASIPINQDRNESNHVVGSTNNNVLNLPKFFDDDCQLWFSTIEILFDYKVLRSKMLNNKVFLPLYTCHSCRQSKLSWLRKFLNHMIQSNLC